LLQTLRKQIQTLKKFKNFTKIDEIIEYVNSKSNIKVKFIDLRHEHTICKDRVISQRKILNGDPKGYTIVNLGTQSQFSLIEPYINRIYGADYDYDELRKHHCEGKHEYYVSNTILDANVVISVPKFKNPQKGRYYSLFKESGWN